MANGSDSDEDDGEAFLEQSDLQHEVQSDDEEMDDAEAEAEDDAIHLFCGHNSSVFSVACSPQQIGVVATGGGDDCTFLWGIGAEEEPKRLEGHTDSVSALGFSVDGMLVASGGLDGVVNIWSAESGELKHKLDGPAEAIEWVQWHPRGRVVLCGSEDFSSWMWNADSGACMAVFSGHRGAVTCGGFTPDGKSVVTGSADASLRIWNPRTGEATAVVSGYGFHSGGLTSLEASSDCTVVISGGEDGRAALTSVAAGKDGVVKLKWHPSAALLFTACLDGCVRVWDGRTGRCEREWKGHRDGILDMAITPDGNFVVTGSDDLTARAFGL